MRGGSLLVTCLVFHVSYFLSIFDIYFRSPIDNGLESVSVEENGPAKRVVLIVADGLRADTCFRFMGRDARYHIARENDVGKEVVGREAHYQADSIIWSSEKESFLRDIVETKGSWGISHTRVPTESRPGHVAVIAGFYEDVSAVTRGWQDNPVEFDHVFNQSRRTWMWGSPDITRMFAKKHEHVHDWFYSPEEEDFAAKDLTLLDTWVFNEVAGMFRRAEANATLREELHQDKVFFFLHLLGLDSNGHAYRPHAPEYYHNMAYVDKGVRGIVQLFEDFFQDNQTAFVFTADHGMGNQGAHGDGHPTNTRTPLVAWGAGIRHPEHFAKSEAAMRYDPRQGINTGFSQTEEQDFTRNWGLDHLVRKDVEQADIAPLLSTLLGVPNPVNSVGRLPLGFLQHNKYSLNSLLRNAKQLAAQVKHKELTRKQRQLFLRPFQPLGQVEENISIVEAALIKDKAVPPAEEMDEEEYMRLQEICVAVMKACIDGLRYYQVYDRPYLMLIIVSGYLGWIAVLAVHLSSPEEDAQTLSWTIPAMLVALVSMCLLVYQVLEQTPLMYHVYVAFSGVFWTYALCKPAIWVSWFQSARENPSRLRTLLCYLAGTQVMVLGYTYRHLFVLLFVGLAFWPSWIGAIRGADTVFYPSHTGQVKQMSSSKLQLVWGLSSLCLGAFTLLPLDMNESPALLVAGALGLTVALTTLFRGDVEGLTPHRFLQLVLLCIALATTLLTDANLRRKEGLPRVNQMVTWSVFLVAPHLCLMSPKTPYKRYLAIFAALGTSFCFLSINYEVLFFTVLGFTLLQWLVIERVIMYDEKGQGSPKSGREGAVSMSDVRTAFIFLLMVHIAFFGTGNIASMSSFQLSATYRFVTVFSPFLMGTLCILAKLVPFMLTTAMVSILARERKAAGVSTVSPHRLFFVVIAMYDLLAVHLFFWVRDHGSWLEIGNSISQFGLANAQCIFLPLLYAIASYFVSGLDITSESFQVFKKAS